MQQLEGLKDKPDFFSPQVRLLQIIQIRRRPAFDPHRARRRKIHRPRQVQQRRFAAPAPPGQRDKLPLGHVQRDSLQRANALAVTCIFFADVLEGENRHASNRRSPGRYFRLVSAFSIAEVRSFESGSTFESNRAITFPSGPIKNFVKFQPISPPVFGLADLSVKNA